eukprot:scaffold781_cov394-Prasinococcus_capsulatus_cf.AAC.8
MRCCACRRRTVYISDLVDIIELGRVPVSISSLLYLTSSIHRAFNMANSDVRCERSVADSHLRDELGEPFHPARSSEAKLLLDHAAFLHAYVCICTWVQAVESVLWPIGEQVIRCATDRLTLGSARPLRCQKLIGLIQGHVTKPIQIGDTNPRSPSQPSRAMYVHPFAILD